MQPRGGLGGGRGGDKWEAGIWSSDLRADERPRKKLLSMALTYIRTWRLGPVGPSWWKNLGATGYRSELCGYLVIALWECISDNRWYSGLALSVGIRSEALTALIYGSLKFFLKNVQKYGSKKCKNYFQLRPNLWETDTFSAVPAWNASDIRCQTELPTFFCYSSIVCLLLYLDHFKEVWTLSVKNISWGLQN